MPEWLIGTLEVVGVSCLVLALLIACALFPPLLGLLAIGAVMVIAARMGV